MLNTPLEQFQVISLVPLKIFYIDISITNILIVNALIVGFLSFILYHLTHSAGTKNFFFLTPNSWQLLVEKSYTLVYQLLFDNLNRDGEKYVPFVSTVFLFIVLSNLIGLIPYSFTVTSHLIITFSVSFSVFIGINVIAFNTHKIQMLNLFIPANTSFFLALILVPIEFISYIAKPISLGVRLFINLMAGHTLLKVVVGFSWSLLLIEDIMSILHAVPMLVLVMLMGLELAVALIQAYVFTVLTCIYLNDSKNLH